MTGTVYLIGAGPGAARSPHIACGAFVGGADVVLHDALVSDEVLASRRGQSSTMSARAPVSASVDQRFICKCCWRGWGVAIRSWCV